MELGQGKHERVVVAACCDQRIFYGLVYSIPKKNEHRKHSAAIMHLNHLPSSASVPAGAYTMQKVTVSLQAAGYRQMWYYFYTFKSTR